MAKHLVLTRELKQELWRLFRQGVTVENLPPQFAGADYMALAAQHRLFSARYSPCSKNSPFTTSRPTKS